MRTLISFRHPHVMCCLAIIAAVWLGFPNDVLHLPPLVLFWPMGLAFLGRCASSSRQALGRGWFSSLTGGLAALYWLGLPVHLVGGLSWLTAMACALGITACITFPCGMFAVAAHLWRKRPLWAQALLLGMVWYLLEELAARILGFPWLSLSNALSAWPILVQIADIVGSYALAGIWTTVVLLSVFGLCKGRCGLPYHAVSIVLLGAILGYGGWQLAAVPFTTSPVGRKTLDVLFVEGNVDQNQKWIPAFQRQTVDLYLTLTEQALGQHPGKHPLVIWPETAMPFFFAEEGLHTPRIRRLAARHGIPLLLGAPGKDDNTAHRPSRVYNRAFLLGSEGDILAYYDKEHLVPFGEYLPEWLHWEFLEALLQGVGVYSEGTSTAPLRQDNLALGVLICYEGIFPWLAQQRVSDGANILVDISNDGWFGKTPAARQHLYATALRALEQNRWILRGTNTGISAVVDTRGRLVFCGGQFQAQALWAKADVQTQVSPYHDYAPWIPFVAMICLIGVYFATSRKKHALFSPLLPR